MQSYENQETVCTWTTHKLNAYIKRSPGNIYSTELIFYFWAPLKFVANQINQRYEMHNMNDE